MMDKADTCKLHAWCTRNDGHDGDHVREVREVISSTEYADKALLFFELSAPADDGDKPLPTINGFRMSWSQFYCLLNSGVEQWRRWGRDA